MFTPQEFRDYFRRDFPFCPFVIPEGESDPVEQVNDECISDSDILRAKSDAELSFRADCLDADGRKTALLYLTAHYLVLNLRNSADGISSNGGYGEASKSVGSVSVSYNSAPEWMKSNPLISSLQQTGYGQRYFELAYRCMMASRFFIVKGRTVN